MRSFAERAEFAASTGGISLLVGANRGLTLSFQGTAGGGLWILSGSPKADPMEVVSFQGTLVAEASCAPVLGAYVYVGALTGLVGGNAVHWLAENTIGSAGQLWVRVPRGFRTEYGLAIYVPPLLTSGDYVILAEGVTNG